MKHLLIISAFLLSLIQAQGWWSEYKSQTVGSYDEFKELVAYDNSTYKDSHLAVTFYMKGCVWCQRFLPHWNRALEEYQDALNVRFLTVDGPEARELCRKYRVQGFPTVLFLRAGKRALDVVEFEDEPRDYDTFTKFLKHVVEKSNKLKEKEDAKPKKPKTPEKPKEAPKAQEKKSEEDYSAFKKQSDYS